LIVPRASFILRKKLKRGLKNHLDNLAQAFRIEEDHADSEEEFEVTFEYAQYQMRKNINDTIAEKHENTRFKRKNGVNKNKNQALLEEMEEITKKRESLLHIVDKVAEYSIEIKEWMAHNPVEGYRINHRENFNKMLIMFESMEESEKTIPPFDSTNFNALMTWIMTANIKEWKEVTNERNQINWQTKFEKVKRIKELRIQHELVDDNKRTVRKIIVDQSPMCNIPSEEVEKFWKGRWEQNPEFHSDYVNDRFPINKFFDSECNDILLNDLTNKDQMMKLISKRGNLSAPGLDGITFPFLKLEKESAAELLIAMLRFIIVKRKIPSIWKTGKAILIFKGGQPNNPGNWRPITLTFILY
jgi:hypothetical protein